MTDLQKNVASFAAGCLIVAACTVPFLFDSEFERDVAVLKMRGESLLALYRPEVQRIEFSSTYNSEEKCFELQAATFGATGQVTTVTLTERTDLEKSVRDFTAFSPLIVQRSAENRGQFDQLCAFIRQYPNCIFTLTPQVRDRKYLSYVMTAQEPDGQPIPPDGYGAEIFVLNPSPPG